MRFHTIDYLKIWTIFCSKFTLFSPVRDFQNASIRPTVTSAGRKPLVLSRERQCSRFNIQLGYLLIDHMTTFPLQRSKDPILGNLFNHSFIYRCIFQERSHVSHCLCFCRLAAWHQNVWWWWHCDRSSRRVDRT